MSLTENGVSTTKQNCTFAHEPFVSHGRNYIQWDYRDSSGKLHSGVAKTLEEAYTRAALLSGELIAR